MIHWFFLWTTPLATVCIDWSVTVIVWLFGRNSSSNLAYNWTRYALARSSLAPISSSWMSRFDPCLFVISNPSYMYPSHVNAQSAYVMIHASSSFLSSNSPATLLCVYRRQFSLVMIVSYAVLNVLKVWKLSFLTFHHLAWSTQTGTLRCTSYAQTAPSLIVRQVQLTRRLVSLSNIQFNYCSIHSPVHASLTSLIQAIPASFGYHG